MKHAAVFVDRDGVINHNWLNPDTGEWESPIRPSDVRLILGASDSLKAIQAAGFLLFMVSNQPSAAKGKCTLADLAAVHEAVRRPLAAAGVVFDDVFYAYMHPNGVVAELTGPSPERKPGSCFLDTTVARRALVASDCWMVGDRGTDIECGRRAGVRTIQVDGSEPQTIAAGPAPDFRAPNLAGAAEIILMERSRAT